MAASVGAVIPIPKPNRDPGRAAESHDCHITLRELSQGNSANEGQSLMCRTVVAVIACGIPLAPTLVKAQDQSDKAAVKQATATCRTEVKEHAKYNEMSLWAQHKAVKK